MGRSTPRFCRSLITPNKRSRTSSTSSATSRPRSATTACRSATIAQLPAAEQTGWLTQSAAAQWSRDELRHKVRVAKAQATGVPVEFWLDVKVSDEVEQEVLAAELTSRGLFVHARAVKV